MKTERSFDIRQSEQAFGSDRIEHTFGPGHGMERDLHPTHQRPELAHGTTRKAKDDSTLTAMAKLGRPLTNPDLGPMRLHTFFDYDTQWSRVLERAEVDAVPAAEVVRRALAAYLEAP